MSARLEHLKNLYRMIVEHEKDFQDAMMKDLHKVSLLKRDFPIAASSPGLNRKYDKFWCQTKAYILLIIIPKFQLQIHYTLKGTMKNLQVIGIPILPKRI